MTDGSIYGCSAGSDTIRACIMRFRWTGIPCFMLGVGAPLPTRLLHLVLHRKTLQCRHRERRCGAAILLVWGAVDLRGMLAFMSVLASHTPQKNLRFGPGQPHGTCSRRRVLLLLCMCVCCLVSLHSEGPRACVESASQGMQTGPVWKTWWDTLSILPQKAH